ncbi:MAG: ubiquitin-activating E1 FCCH domain-containing protein [Rhizomicrobium sp.]|nr:ubiquitin-activating E1 FCCH domain-containing protein [Rhizomicrobium sp.]
MQILARLLQRFWVERRGNVAMIFAVALVPLLIAVGAGLDFGRAVLVRTNLTEALDVAGLAVGSAGNLSTAATQALAQSYFKANYTVDSSYGTPSAVTVSQNGQDFTLNTTVTMPTVLMQIAGVSSLPVSSSVVITRNSKNIEVALALDTTGSMAGTKIADLKTAADQLIDIVVQDVQSPTYTKVAIAPYTMGVNVGTYADQVRGPIAAGKTITGATKANPVVITAPTHAYANGDLIYISGVVGMTQLNGNTYTVANKTTNTFELKNIDGRNYYSYSSGGTARCTKLGCKYYNFSNAAGGSTTLGSSTCVSERTTNAYTDAAPSTTLLGYNYAATGNDCITATIIPLSTDRAALHSVVDGLSAAGSTAGHIGVAWAWYLLAPNFSSLWPSGSAPAAYGGDNLIKVAIIMTDGAFNTPYCSGVIAKDAGSGSGNTSDHIACNAPNGSSAAQSKQLCSAMKAKGIIIYTVGFEVGSDATALDTLNSCASDAAHAYFPASGGELKSAFQDIAQQITNLRLKS